MKALPRVRTASAALLIALTGALLAAASPAAAQDAAMAERTTSLSACVGAAVEVFGFEDIVDLSNDRQDAINCLAYYGITRGMTAAPDPVTYGPESNVTRSQMALFLYRAADVAGVDLEPGADDPAAMFSDISELGDNRQAAIKALYSKSIMTGRNITGMTSLGAPSEDTFAPDEPINRAEMAVYLRNIVRAASPDLFDDDGELADIEKLDQFMDARHTTTGATSDAVAAIYELGITSGQTATTYNPGGFVRRSNMALFITRTLAHTTLRPAGLTVQQDGAKIVASLRDRTFSPVNDAYVDVFVADIEDADDAFDADGECDTDVVRESPRYYHDACEIDVADAQTDNGDTEIDFSEELTSDGLVVWVWSGDLRDTADEDGVVETRFNTDDLPPPAASQMTVTYSGLRTQPDGETVVMTARKGTKVTVHLQMQGSYIGEEDELVDVPAPSGETEYSLDVETTVPDGDDVDEDPDLYERRPARRIALSVDGSGSFELPVFDISEYDVTFTLTPVNHDVYAKPGTETVGFRSGDPTATTVVVDPIDVWVQTTERSAGATSRNNVHVMVLDQYGRPMANVNVLLTSSADGQDPDVWGLVTRSRGYTTRSNGVLIGYNYSGGAVVERLIAGIDNDAEDTDGHGALPEDPAHCADPTQDRDNAMDVCGTASVYWADEAPDTSQDDTSQDDTYAVVHADTDNEKIVVQKGVSAPVVIDYEDANTGDAFYVDGAAPRNNTYAENVAAFEAALREALETGDEYELTWEQPEQGRWTFNLISPA